MSSGLLVFGGLTDDSESSLAGILGLLTGLVGLGEMFLECFVYGDRLLRERMPTDRTPLHASIGSPVRREIILVLRHCHADSVRRTERSSNPVDFNRHHYPLGQSVDFRFRWVSNAKPRSA